MRAFFFLSLTLLMISACGSDPPTFPDVTYDSGLECSDGEPVDGGSTDDLGPCPAGQLCLQGRCYDACTGDAECAATEMCSSDGRCVPRTTPLPDGGPPMDTGPADPCDGVMCEGSEMCHPIGGVCVECLGSTCAASMPICDLAFGTCKSFTPRVCAPCNVDGDCMGPGGENYGDCVMNETQYERVCSPTCGDSSECPSGLVCNPEGRCAPRAGTCTGFISGVDAKPCTMDTDCVPFGAPTAPGQCTGLMSTMDGATPMGVCREPCGLLEDCRTGTMCIAGFCMPV